MTSDYVDAMIVLLVLGTALLGGIIGVAVRRRTGAHATPGPFRKDDHTEQVVHSGFTNINSG